MADKGLDRWADEMLDQRFADAAVSAEVRQWFDTTQRRSDAAAIVALGELLLGVDLSPRLAGLRPPLLILAPQQSPFIPAETFEAMHAAVRGSLIHRFDSARHGLPLSHGRRCAELARDFIVEKVETK
jgi:pimeloyl-ACP methyl ester carboxylesterase